jgi:exopolysaccharide production protein ExoQ
MSFVQPDSRLRWGLVFIAAIFFGSLFFVRLHSFTKSIDVYAEDLDAGEELEGGTRNTEKTAAFLLMAVAAVYCIFAISGARVDVHWTLALLLAFHLLVCAASFLWSTNPPMTLRRVAMVLVCALVAIGLGRQFRLRELLVLNLFLAGGYAVVGLFAELALGTFQPFSPEYRFAGTVHPNEQGVLCGSLAVGSVLLAMDLRRYRLVLWGVAALAISGLLLTRSRTALVGTTCSFALAAMLLTPARYWPHFVVIGGFSLSSLVAFVAAAPAQFRGSVGATLLLGRGEGASSLTGRLPVWEGLIPYLSERPWLGFGYRAFWDKARVDDFRHITGGWQVPDAHNSYLEMVLSVGLIGAIPLFLAMLLAMAILARRAMRAGDIGAAFFAGLILSLFIGGFAEATLFNNSMFSCLMATCAVARLTLHRTAVDAPLADHSPTPVDQLETTEPRFGAERFEGAL